MEVIGLVAAVPGLIQITQTTISVIQAFISQGRFVKQITELLGQLESIERILQDIQGRLKSSTIHHSNFDRLATEVQGLRSELAALNDLLQPLATSPSRKANALKRGRLLISGFEGKIKKCSERLGKVNSSLILVIVTRNGAVAEEILTLSKSDRLLKLRDVLLPCGYGFIPQKLQGTCEWIWSHPVFCQWQKGPTTTSPIGHEHRLLCIHGTKGCGKSVLAASIVEKLNFPFNSAVGFSFWAGSHNQQKLLVFLRTFLWHLIQRVPDDNLTQVSKSLQENIPLTERALENLISLALKTIKSHVYCIIDGIDESVDDWTRIDAGGLRLVISLLRGHSNLRIILLGRDTSMRVAASLTPLSIEITEELVRPDINQLILHHLDSSLKIRDEATRQLVQKTLQESSRVMFLWVSLIFGELDRCQLPSEIVRTLQQVPRDLDREYHRLFLRLQDRLGGTKKKPSLAMERAKCLLSWIIVALEPLTYEELRCAFAISQCPDEGYEQYFLSEDGIMDTCGDFIRVSDGRYHMIHASVAEFLTRPIGLWQDEDEAINYFCIDAQQSQSQMCLECITYFQRIELGYPLTDATTVMSYVDLPVFSCALKYTLIYLRTIYASEHWKSIWEYLVDFMGTPQFHSLIEYGFMCQNECSITLLEQQEIMNFFSWLTIERRVDQPLPLLLKGTKFQGELARRESVYGVDNTQFHTWKSLVRWFMDDLEGNQTMTSTLLNATNSSADRTHRTLNTEVGRAAEHTAMLKIGEMVACKAPVLQTLAKAIPNFTSIVPELLPIPVLILLALRQTTYAAREKYWSSALKRLTGANNILEALCAYALGICRYWQNKTDETVVGLLDRSREIAAILPPSLHLDILLCNTLLHLSRALIAQGKFSEAQEIVSELQQRLADGPTKGYLNTPLERKLYYPLFWDNWKAEILADAANDLVPYWRKDRSCIVKALSMLDSNMQLYKDPGRWRIRASVKAYQVKAAALFKLWVQSGGEIPSELAHNSEAACHVVLRLTQFPNSSKYRNEQWLMLDGLYTLLWRAGRYDEARELVSRTSADLLSTKWSWCVMNAVATMACLGDIDAAEALLEQANMKIRSNQLSLRQFKSNLVPDLITALIKVRPILQLWPVVCKYYCSYERDQDFWYETETRVLRHLNPCVNELWDIFRIQGLGLVDHEKHIDIFEYDDLAFEYALKQQHEAATIVSRFLISYALAKQPLDWLQWGLYHMALSLHFTSRDEEALAVYRSMLFWTEKRVPCEFRAWSYHSIGIACLRTGEHRGRKETPFSTEFLKLAAISLTRARDDATAPDVIQLISDGLSLCLPRLEKLGISSVDEEPVASPKVNPSMRFENGLLRHQSCPDLQGRYFKEVPRNRRAAYNLWRKQSIKPT